MRRTIVLVIAALVTLTALATPAQAGRDVPAAYVTAASRHGVPPAILYAVALAESRMALGNGMSRPWPWTLNVAGQGHYFPDRASACAALQRHLRSTRNVDVGITQINVRHNPDLYGQGRRFADPCAALDPYANLDEAARLLRRHYGVTRNWLDAAGRYHRPAGGAPAERYRRIVAQNLARLQAAVDTMPADPPEVASLGAMVSEAEALGNDVSPIAMWVEPDAPVSTWIDPENRWYRLVAAHY